LVLPEQFLAQHQRELSFVRLRVVDVDLQESPLTLIRQLEQFDRRDVNNLSGLQADQREQLK
jgi:hypothetical protein